MSAADILAILQGAVVTVTLSSSASCSACRSAWARAPALGGVPVAAQVVPLYVSVLRATPLVTLLLLFFFALPNVGVPIGPDLGGDPGAGHEHLGLQLRDLARGADEFSEGPV